MAATSDLLAELQRRGVSAGDSVLVEGPAGSRKAAAVHALAAAEGWTVSVAEPADMYTTRHVSGDRCLGPGWGELVEVAGGGSGGGGGVLLVAHLDVLLQDAELHTQIYELLTRREHGLPRGWVFAATARSAAALPGFVKDCFTHVVEAGLPTFADRVRMLREVAAAASSSSGGEAEATAQWLAGKLGGLGWDDVEEAGRRVLRGGGGGGLEGARARYQEVESDTITFGQRTADVTIPSVRWADVVGHVAAGERLRAALTLHKVEAAVAAALGLTPCSGVLLYGLPGNGKTLLAKAVATELGAMFLLGSIPSLVKGYVGESERMVRELFARARRNAPCCVFLDEVQAVFGDREDAEGGGGHDARIVSELLTQIDAVPPGVFVLAATNTPRALDAALLAPGRLDLHIHVAPPTAEERLGYLQAHLPAALAGDAGLVGEAAEELTERYTYSDLAGLVHVARIRGCVRYAAAVTQPSYTRPMLDELTSWAP